jgi:predicted membrane protein
MLKEIIITPIIAVFIIGFALQLAEVAESASGKVLNFADDMNEALDCALMGVDIYQCSPELREYDFSDDLEEYRDINLEYLNELKILLENATIQQEENVVVITINKTR